MNKYVYATAITIIAAMLSTSSARAEMPPQGQGAKDPQAKEANKDEEALKLKDRKAEVVLMINNRMADMQKRKDCIQAANDMEAFRACMPSMGGPGGHGGGSMMGKPDGQPQDHK